MFDIAVAWRIYPKISKTPLIYPTDKFRLVKTCLQSFLSSVTGLRVRYYFILDGCPPEYEQLINELFQQQHFSVIKTDGIGNLATFALQVDILTKQTDAEQVYFAEDDYLYQPGEFKKMHRLLQEEKGVDFVSCYFSKDIYQHPIHRHKRMIRYNSDQLWLSVSSTCMTFLTKKQTLSATKNLLLTYSKGNNDCAIWLILTKTHIWNPFRYLWYFNTRKQDKESFNILKVAVKYSFSYFFSFRRYTLWVPYPGIGVHLEKDLVVAPETWLQLAKNIDNNLHL